jgi:hypothetical protein
MATDETAPATGHEHLHQAIVIRPKRNNAIAAVVPGSPDQRPA